MDSRLEAEQIQREARRAAAARTGPTSRYTDALTRYLAAQGYAIEPAHRAGRQPPAPLTGVASAGPVHHTPAVVVGVDDSPGSYVAADHAAVEADLRHWEVRLVHAQRAVLGPRALSEQRDHGASLLAEVGERVRCRAPDLPVATALRVGSPGDVLLAEAATAGLTVLGNRGHGAVGGMLSPSLSLHLAQHAPGPVLVVRVPAWPPGGDWSERPVVVGVDDSPGSAAALEFAIAEARLRGTGVTAVHAAASGHAPGSAPLGLLTAAEREHPDVAVRRRAVHGDPSEVMIEASARAAAVVVGAAGRRRLGGLLPGSVARTLIKRAHCPVFLVPPAGPAPGG